MSIRVKFRKLTFLLTPKRLRPRWSRDNPWLARYEIGEWTYGRPKVLDWGSGSKLKIGRFCSIAGGVTIFLDNGDHHTDWVSAYPFPQSLHKLDLDPSTRFSSKGDVTIGNDVWIGDGATILSGVRIGNGAVIGAACVLAKDVPPYSIAVGNPAKILKQRFTASQIEALERIAWWDWPIEKIREAMPLIMSPSIDDFIQKYS